MVDTTPVEHLPLNSNDGHVQQNYSTGDHRGSNNGTINTFVYNGVKEDQPSRYTTSNHFTADPGANKSDRITEENTKLHIILNKLNESRSIDADKEVAQSSPNVRNHSNTTAVKAIETVGERATLLQQKSQCVNSSTKESKMMGQSTSYLSRREYVMILYSFLVTCPMNLTYGNGNPFSSPLLEEINRPNSTTFSAISNNENCVYQNLIGPSAMIGGAIGASLTMAVCEIFGSVNGLIATALVSTLGWVMIGTSWFVLAFPSLLPLFWCLLILGRIVTGIGMGLTLAMILVYYGMIAPDEKHRTVFIVSPYVLYAVASIETYILGSYLPYWICAFIYAGQQAILFPFLFFIIRPQEEKEQTVCSRIHKLKASLGMKISNLSSINNSKSQVLDFSTRMFLSLVLIFMHVYMGYAVILMYVGPILQVAGADHWSVPHGVLIALTVGGSDLVGSIASIWLTNILGRVFACVIGASGVCVGYLSLTAYFVLVEGLGPSNHYHNTTGGGWMNGSTEDVCFFEPTLHTSLGEQYSPLGMVGLAVVMLSYGIFWMSQPYIIMVEIFPDQWRPLGTGLSVGLTYINDGILTAVFPLLVNAIGIAWCFLTLAIISASAVVIVPALIPETKGHPMGERGGEFTPRRNLIEFGQYLKSFLPGVACVTETTKAETKGKTETQ